MLSCIRMGGAYSERKGISGMAVRDSFVAECWAKVCPILSSGSFTLLALFRILGLVSGSNLISFVVFTALVSA